MTVGSPATTSLNGTKKGLAYTCLQTILTRGYETPDFPTKPCPAGIMGKYDNTTRIYCSLMSISSDPSLP
jgi:hypothetical protein